MMFILFCYILCAFGVFELVCALSTKAKDADWMFLKGLVLVVVGVFLGLVLKCTGVS